MSPKATALVGAAALAVGAAAACSASNAACFRDCPPLEGRWQVTFEPAADPSECQQLGAGVADGELVITRRTSQLAATFGGQELSGTLFDTWSFALDGQAVMDGGLGDAFSFRGAFTRGQDGGTAADGGGGDRLDGLYDATLRRPGPQGTLTCRLVRSYSATRK